MDQVRKLGAVSLFAASAALALLGCKKETFQAPGATQEEINREGTGAAHDHRGSDDLFLGMPGATPEEVEKEQGKQGDESAKKSTTLSTPGESVGEAKGKGIVPEGTGGGPRDESAPPSPSSQTGASENP